MIFKTMKGTLIFFITILFAFISLFIFFYFPSQFEKLEVKSLLEKASVLNKMSAYSISPALNFNDPDNIKEVASGIIRNKDIMYLIIEDGSGSIKFHYNDSLAFRNNYKIINDKLEPDKNLIYKTLEKVVYRNITVGNIYAGYSLVPIREEMVNNRTVIAIVSIIIFMIATFLLNIIGRLALRPLTEITNTARSISHENLNIRAKETFGEIGELAKAFNLMIEKLEKSRMELENWNRNLENVVRQRTVELQKGIDERILTEKQLIIAKNTAESANKLKDAFIANISHEIRTPLTGILGMTSIIKDTFHDKMKEEDEELFEGIDISSHRIIRTIDMILNYSRLQVGGFNITPNKINISHICISLVKEFSTSAKNKSLELSFQNNIGDTAVFADEYSITMAISNLIDNAIKFTNNGSVNVILHKEKNDDLILDVKDTGIGIDKEYLNHIFEPYRQEDMRYGRAYDGIGLGLAIVKKILDLNKCSINVESKKGEGTTFSINLGKGEQPLKNKIEASVTTNILSALEEIRKEVVLLVEDDLMNQVTIRRFIEKKYRVIITDSSDEAMEIIKKEKVDIILMDISVKGSKNGLELTKELKASDKFSHIPIMAVTAHALVSDRKNSLDAGCDDYLAKPFTVNQLLIKIDKLVQSSYN